MSEKLDSLFEKYLACEPNFEELDDLLRQVDVLKDQIYPHWLEKLNELLKSKPDKSEMNILLVRLKAVFKWKDVKNKEIAEKLLELDPSDDTFLLIMEKLPSYEEDLLMKIKDKKKKYLYLMEKEAKKLRK